MRVTLPLSRSLALSALLAMGCAAEAPSTVPSLRERSVDMPLVDTGPWLTTVSDPPPAWRRVLEGRRDVVRSRFVRFSAPESLPDPESRFILRPFLGTRIVLRMRRAGPVGDDAYSWFGMYEDDPRGWGGIVVRPNGRVAVEIQTPEGPRYQVVNVATHAYAVLELRPQDGGDE